MRFRGLCKAGSDGIERVQYGIMQFLSDAAAIMQQGAQSLLGFLEGGGGAVSDLIREQKRNRLSRILGNLLQERGLL